MIYLRAQDKRQSKTETTDNALVKQLLADHSSALLRFIRVRSRLSASDCEDVLQEVYERLLKQEQLQEKLDGRQDTVRNYLFQIATHLLIDRARRAKVRQSDHHISETEVTMLSTLYSPERLLNSRLQLQQIQQVLSELKTSHQQAFLLNRVDGKSYREISDILGVSVSTIEKYISTALLAIRSRTEIK